MGMSVDEYTFDGINKFGCVPLAIQEYERVDRLWVVLKNAIMSPIRINGDVIQVFDIRTAKRNWYFYEQQARVMSVKAPGQAGKGAFWAVIVKFPERVDDLDGFIVDGTWVAVAEKDSPISNIHTSDEKFRPSRILKKTG